MFVERVTAIGWPKIEWSCAVRRFSGAFRGDDDEIESLTNARKSRGRARRRQPAFFCDRRWTKMASAVIEPEGRISEVRIEGLVSLAERVRCSSRFVFLAFRF